MDIGGEIVEGDAIDLDREDEVFMWRMRQGLYMQDGNELLYLNALPLQLTVSIIYILICAHGRGIYNRLTSAFLSCAAYWAAT